MEKRTFTSPHVSSLHIPERQFWLPEAAEKYLNEDGRFRINPKTGEYDFEQIEIPLIDKDNYPIVDIPAMVDTVKSLFVPEYAFPKRFLSSAGIVKMDDNIDHVQHDESDYHPSNFTEYEDREKEPEYFRDSAERKVRMPWLFHNAKTILVEKPPMPDIDLMRDHYRGAKISADLLVAAIGTIRAGRSFTIRKHTIASRAVTPKTHDDRVGREFLGGRHTDQYTKFLQERDRLANIPEYTIFSNLKEELADMKPIDTIRALAGVATREAWDYSGYIRGTSNSPQSKNPRRNPMLRRALSATHVYAA